MTPQQFKVLKAIERLTKLSPITPSFREIANDVGIGETAVAKHIKNLVHGGYLRRTRHRLGIKITGRGVVALAREIKE